LLQGTIPSLKDEKGYYFVDRDGKYFEPILEYLRTGYLNIGPNLSREVLLLLPTNRATPSSCLLVVTVCRQCIEKQIFML